MFLVRAVPVVLVRAFMELVLFARQYPDGGGQPFWQFATSEFQRLSSASLDGVLFMFSLLPQTIIPGDGRALEILKKS